MCPAFVEFRTGITEHHLGKLTGQHLATKLWGMAEDLHWMVGFAATLRLRI